MSPNLEAAIAGVGLRLRRLTASDGARRARLGSALAASLALHAWFASELDWHGVPPLPTPPPSEVRFEVVAPVPAPEPPAPEPPRAPVRTVARIKATPEPPKPPEPTAVPEPQPPAEVPAPEAPSGVTLTGAGAAAFVMPAGNGEARSAVLGALGVSRALPGAGAAEKPGPRLVPLADLGTRPSPPSLAAALGRNYPPEARRRGIAGHASVRARIDADGVPRALRLVEETFAGFGAACRQTLAGSRWSPPRDHGGSAVASEVLYTCRFVITP